MFSLHDSPWEVLRSRVVALHHELKVEPLWTQLHLHSRFFLDSDLEHCIPDLLTLLKRLWSLLVDSDLNLEEMTHTWTQRL